MYNIKKYNKKILKILKDKKVCTKIKIFFSTVSYGDFYDEFEDNKTYTNLNPITIKGIVVELTSETIYYKKYGQSQSGIVEVLVEEKYRKVFENCTKIEINDVTYSVFKDAEGSRASIIKRPFRMIKIALSRKD